MHASRSDVDPHGARAFGRVCRVKRGRSGTLVGNSQVPVPKIALGVESAAENLVHGRQASDSALGRTERLAEVPAALARVVVFVEPQETERPMASPADLVAEEAVPKQCRAQPEPHLLVVRDESWLQCRVHIGAVVSGRGSGVVLVRLNGGQVGLQATCQPLEVAPASEGAEDLVLHEVGSLGRGKASKLPPLRRS